MYIYRVYTKNVLNKPTITIYHLKLNEYEIKIKIKIKISHPSAFLSQLSIDYVGQKKASSMIVPVACSVGNLISIKVQTGLGGWLRLIVSNDPSSFSYFSIFFFFFIHLMLASKIHSWSRLIRTCTTHHTSSHTCKYHGREYMRIVHTHTDRLETHSRGTHVREHTLSQLTQKEGEHYEDRLRCWRACCRVPVLHCSWMLSWNKNNEGWISVCPALPVPTGTLRFFFPCLAPKGDKGR